MPYCDNNVTDPAESWAPPLAPWAEVPFGNWEAEQFAAWLEDFRAWARTAGYEWDHAEQLRDALTMWHAERTEEMARAERQAAAAAQSKAERQTRDAREQREAEERRRAEELRRQTERAETEEAQWRELVIDEARRTATDPVSLRAVVAWSRSMPDVKLQQISAAAYKPLKVEGDRLTLQIKTREEEIARAEAQFAAERLLRLATGQPPFQIPAPIDISLFVDADSVARWLVFHAGRYTLTVGRWQTVEDRDQNTNHVLNTSRVLRQPIGWRDIEQRCERWATWQRFAAAVADHPAEAERLSAAGIDVLRDDVQYRELIAEQDGRWSFKPSDPGGRTPFKETEPRTVATRGPRVLTDEKLDERIEQRVRRFWTHHQRGPATEEELAQNIRGARRTRILGRIKALLDNGTLIEMGKGIRVDG
ncbi:MAG TPA: hypothetical protein VFD85_15480 [Gemmatimonadales bacterium]|nr:hypothetical protein [Gemmatimonadales bacterium]